MAQAALTRKQGETFLITWQPRLPQKYAWATSVRSLGILFYAPTRFCIFRELFGLYN